MGNINFKDIQPEKIRLDKLSLPDDLKKLNFAQCDELCKQIRELLIETVSNNGGHLSSNLGTVELTVAIHRVFDSPNDKIVFDVGHQAYTHKILTGRLNKFDSLRKKGGISGFCKPCESVHDPVVTGHSSTAVSSAYGIASAMKIMGSKNYAVAVVGDGALTGGITYEGMNNAGKSDVNLVVILNINEMSISKNVGSMAKYLSTLRYKDSYIKTKDVVENVLNSTPVLGKPIKNALISSKNLFKNMVLNCTLFEDMGFEYVGPINGHDIKELEAGLKAAKNKHRPVVVTVYTVKGKGYGPAEENPGEYHGIGSFEIETGNPDVVADDSFSTVFGKELVHLGKMDKRICAITAAMKYGTGLQYFAKVFPERFYDVGIAEEHAVTFCSGLSVLGMVPVFAVYSTFLQRSIDQIIHDLSIGGVHAVIGVDRAGIVGDDGETHNGIFDIPLLTSVPGIKIYSPSTYGEVKVCLNSAVYRDHGVSVIRYPRGCDKTEIPGFRVVSTYKYSGKNNDLLVVSYGRLINNVLKAKDILMRENKDFDTLKLINVYPVADIVRNIIGEYDKVLFFEESFFEGSISQKIMSEFPNVKAYAIHGFIKQQTVEEAFEEVGFLPEQIAQKIRENIDGDKT